MHLFYISLDIFKWTFWQTSFHQVLYSNKKMLKKNPMMKIGLKRSHYLSPPHFLMFFHFPGLSGDLYVFSLTNSYISENIKIFRSQIVLLLRFESQNHNFYLLSFGLTLCFTPCQLLSFVVNRCHSLSLVVTHCINLWNSFSLVIPFAVTRCHSI